MRLSEFLRTHSEEILLTWDEFASTVEHRGKHMDQKALRDHAAQILYAIAEDLESPQTEQEQIAKSRGEVDREHDAPKTAAETHADTRILAGFAIDAMITEYRALRASVLRLWARHMGGGNSEADNLEQLTRFNEAIDQALSESVSRYTEQVRQYTNLFMGMLGHDIRNPLGSIHLSAQLLMHKGILAKQDAAPIVNGVKRIQDIVELIVDFSRAQADGTMPVHVTPGTLEEVFESVVAETRVRHPGTIIVLKASGDTSGDWDPARLSQLLSNLLQNAVTYGTRELPVRVALEGGEGYVAFSVHNHGKAISGVDRERIFEPRHRGVGGEERAPDGLGLGLYICREIVKAHGGKLSLRSNEVDGTTFTVRLPRRQDADMQAFLGSTGSFQL
jgi:signal transduction histidine kinase